MARIDEYNTVGGHGQDELVEKKSRFIGYACPVETAEDALDFVKSIKKKHNDARHNCFAYALRDGSVRYSDDGEPQGTAGQPILDVITRGKICDCVVVVTRYFGGVLLGTGGLTHAYSDAAKLAVSAAGIITMKRMLICPLVCDYSFYGSVQTLIAKYGVTVSDSVFEDNVRLELLCPPENYGNFAPALTELSAGRMKLEQKGEKFIKKR